MTKCLPKNICVSLNYILSNFSKYFPLHLLGGDSVCFKEDAVEVKTVGVPLKGECFEEKFNVPDEVKSLLGEIHEYGRSIGTEEINVEVPEKGNVQDFWMSRMRNNYLYVSANEQDIQVVNFEEFEMIIAFLQDGEFSSCKAPSNVTRFFVWYLRSVLEAVGVSGRVECTLDVPAEGVMYLAIKGEKDYTSVMNDCGFYTIEKNGKRVYLPDDDYVSLDGFFDFSDQILRDVDKITINYGGGSWDRNQLDKAKLSINGKGSIEMAI